MPTYTHYLKTGATDPPIRDLLREADGSVVSLAGISSIVLHAKKGTDALITLTGAVNDVDTADVQAVPAVDTFAAGTYSLEWYVDRGSGRLEIVPNHLVNKLIVTAKLS